MRARFILLLVGIFLVQSSILAQTTRVKDVTRLEGVRNNQLVGYGLVVGLDGTGDSNQTQFTTQSMANMLTRFGIQAPADQIKVKNIAAVMITADLRAFARSGDRLDVLVSSIGDARSLQGGTLLQTPLMGADSKVYAVAQGPISLGGFSAGGTGASAGKNFPTVGRIPNGAIVEKEVSMTLSEGERITLSLSDPDFSSAAKIVQAIKLGTGADALAEDAGRVRVIIPEKYQATQTTFIAMIGEVPVDIEPVSKVVINERTGTIVIGGAVKLSTVAIAHGSLTVSVSKQSVVSQPLPRSGGKTTVVPTEQVAVEETPASTMLLKSGDTIEDLIKALNAIKATPRDIIAILQAIKEAGGLHGNLEIL